jgi:hypothetical protein
VVEKKQKRLPDPSSVSEMSSTPQTFAVAVFFSRFKSQQILFGSENDDIQFSSLRLKPVFSKSKFLFSKRTKKML